MTKRNILCLLLAAALLVQPISLRTWAEKATEETHLLAKLIYVEARGESEDGQQAIAEVVLNRYTSGLFGKSLSAMIQDEDAFVPRKLLNAANRPRHNMRPSTEPCMAPMCCQRMSCSMAESAQQTANGVPSEATSSVTQEDTWQQKPTD